MKKRPWALPEMEKQFNEKHIDHRNALECSLVFILLCREVQPRLVLAQI